MTQQAVEPHISVIVRNWHGLGLLDACFESLANQTCQNKEFILVDDGSTDGGRELVAARAERLPNAQANLLNTGFRKWNNITFAWARGEEIALFDSDAIAERDWLKELMRYGDLTNHVGMLASRILFQDPEHMIDNVGQYDKAEEILWLDACAALYHRNLLKSRRIR